LRTKFAFVDTDTDTFADTRTERMQRRNWQEAHAKFTTIVTIF